MHVELSTMDLFKKVFASRLMLTVAAIGVTAGVLRNGIMNWYRVFANQAKQPGTAFFTGHWGLLVCIAGILGGFVGDTVRTNSFNRAAGRPPPYARPLCFCWRD
jgi:MFS transporter, OPA family, glycerol-3-phosphate transporter